MMRGHVHAPTDRVWIGGANLLSGVGGGICLIKAWVLAASVLLQPRPPGTPWLLLLSVTAATGFIGVVGVQAAMWGQVKPAALSQAIAGVSAVFLDALGVLAPPPILPGVCLMSAAGILLSRDRVVRSGATSEVTQVLAHATAHFGLLAHIVVAVRFLAVGLVAPAWAVAGLYSVWGAMLVGALRVRQRVPWLVPIIPVLTFVLMSWLLMLGGSMFNWQP